ELHFAGKISGRIAAILNGSSPPILPVGPLSGTRDFLDVRDVCLALGLLVQESFEGLCNVGSGVETRVASLLQMLFQAAGLSETIEIEEDTRRTDPIPRHVANIDRLSASSFVPGYSLPQTCEEMLNYYAQLKQRI